MALMEGFNLALEECGLLFDLGMRGKRFTWERGRGTENWVEERLDRAVAMADWCTLFPHATVYNHDVLKDTGCKDVVVNSWISYSGEVLPTRLEKCSLDLKKWGGDFVRRIGREIDLLQSQLNNLRGRRDVTTLVTVKELDAKLRVLLDQQNVYWRQRAKQHWLFQGDRNTKFFHQYASARKRKNRILKLRDDSDQWVEGGEVLRLAMQYFQTVFTSKGSVQGDSLDGLLPSICDDDNQKLLRPFGIDEVKDALFSMAPDKSLGPDGYSPTFYQHFWGEMGHDIA
ncbi:uncharacterized protein LOC116005858 [Ipomoea triloba]|uniref:uncharacterized protein LOC116005858 n=1 Tax=Ipomoea triloba TaxID=35885 RepID=UPI00125E0365|nr:uncharacterized protein LOC116005858 [Ipomoea triloba]